MASSPRFLFGFLSQSIEAINIALPWQSSVEDGLFKLNYDLVEATKTNLIAWAKTNWGERPFRFQFGLDARRFLFEPEHIAKHAIEANAQEQLARFFSHLTVERLEVQVSSENPLYPANVVNFLLEVSFKDSRKKIKIQETLGS